MLLNTAYRTRVALHSLNLTGDRSCFLTDGDDQEAYGRRQAREQQQRPLIDLRTASVRDDAIASNVCVPGTNALEPHFCAARVREDWRQPVSHTFVLTLKLVVPSLSHDSERRARKQSKWIAKVTVGLAMAVCSQPEQHQRGTKALTPAPAHSISVTDMLSIASTSSLSMKIYLSLKVPSD